MKRIIYTFISIIFAIGVVGGIISMMDHPSTSTPIATHLAANYFSYHGENGKDALTLLKSKAKEQQDMHGLVISINGRTAQNTKREYWAFFVNGKMADVGPAAYKTKNSDVIEWKIEKY